MWMVIQARINPQRGFCSSATRRHVSSTYAVLPSVLAPGAMVVMVVMVVAPGAMIVPRISPVQDYGRRGHDDGGWMDVHWRWMDVHWRRDDHAREWDPDAHRYMDPAGVCRTREG